jgi:hypothetical protein
MDLKDLIIASKQSRHIQNRTKMGCDEIDQFAFSRHLNLPELVWTDEGFS